MSRPIEGSNPNQNKKHFSFMFISLLYFSNPNLYSSLVPMVIEGVLDGLSTLGQVGTRSP
jgi:hypothetical protein